MQNDKNVKIPTIKIERDKETLKITDIKKLANTIYTSKNNAEAFILKQEMKDKIKRLKK